MTLANLMVRDVTIVHPALAADRYGNELPDWDSATTTTAKAWYGAEPGTEETGTRVGALIQRGTLIIEDLTVALAGADRVIIDGVTYELDGPPLTAWTPRGPHHIEAGLRAVVG